MKYIIGETHTEYNDEYYEVYESYTHSSRVVESKEKAEELLREKIATLFNDHSGKFKPDFFNFANYQYAIDKEALQEYLKSIGAAKFDETDWEIELKPDATLEQCLEAYRISGLELYQIIEIPELEQQNEVKTLETLDDIIREVEIFEKIENDLNKKVEASLPLIFKKVLENSKLKWFYWTQCAPAWNDGDPCVFSVNHYISDYFNDKWLEEYIDDRSEQAIKNLEDSELSSESNKNLKSIDDTTLEIEVILRSIPAQILENIYGDSSKIIVTDKGVIIREDYYSEY